MRVPFVSVSDSVCRNISHKLLGFGGTKDERTSYAKFPAHAIRVNWRRAVSELNISISDVLLRKLWHSMCLALQFIITAGLIH